MDEIQRLFANGVAIILIATVLDLGKNLIFDTGESYVSIFNEFASKKETALFLVGAFLITSIVGGLARKWQVSALMQPRVFWTGIGLSLLLLVYLTNKQAANWKLNDGNRSTYATLAVGLCLVVVPWL